jgi:hypothetical protein
VTGTSPRHAMHMSVGLGVAASDSAASSLGQIPEPPGEFAPLQPRSTGACASAAPAPTSTPARREESKGGASSPPSRSAAAVSRLPRARSRARAARAGCSEEAADIIDDTSAANATASRRRCASSCAGDSTLQPSSFSDKDEAADGSEKWRRTLARSGMSAAVAAAGTLPSSKATSPELRSPPSAPAAGAAAAVAAADAATACTPVRSGAAA